MKFKSFDDLIAYLHGKDFSTLEFQIHDESENDAPCNTCNSPDSQAEPHISAQPATTPVTMMSLSDKPTIDFQISNESTIVVDEFNHIPNSCSASKIVIENRTLFLTVCESENLKPYIKMDVEVEGKMIIGKKFFITTDSTIGNQISL